MLINGLNTAGDTYFELHHVLTLLKKLSEQTCFINPAWNEN